jgi:hypothetical protein
MQFGTNSDGRHYFSAGRTFINHFHNKTLKEGIEMKKALTWKKLVWMLIGAGGLMFGFLMFGSNSVAMQEDKGKKMNYTKAYALYQQKCLGCHISVADPEKAGQTRDDWFLVVQKMQNHGLGLTDAESGTITDLLYNLRMGIEKEAG